MRDPVRVCAEIARVGKAGYIETPSRLEEQSYGFQGPWVGWGHHHWLVEIAEGRIEFVFKHHVMHGRESDHFPERLPRHADAGGARRRRSGGRARSSSASAFIEDADELDPYLADFVAAELERSATSSARRKWFVF